VPDGNDFPSSRREKTVENEIKVCEVVFVAVGKA